MVNKTQSLSDLLDDQCSADDLGPLLDDSETNERWFRYQTVSAILKEQHSASASSEFFQSVSAKIDAEPSIIAAPSQQTQQTTAEIHPFVAEVKRLSSGFAIAATVAFATFFSVQTMQVADTEAVLNDSAIAANAGQSEISVNQQSTAGMATTSSDYNEQAEAEIFDNLYFQKSPRRNKVGIAQVSGEYVQTIRFSAEQWQVILERSLRQQAELEAAKKNDQNQSQKDNDE
jgi:negative regulator of sigma E activity